MIAVCVIASAFVMPGSTFNAQTHYESMLVSTLSCVPRESEIMMRQNDGERMIWFGKYKDEKTWEEVLLEDPAYCDWILSQPTRLGGVTGFAAFQKWLMAVKSRRPAGVLYHYTDTSSAKAILGSGVLLPSLKSSGDAYYGDGVYFTSLSPQNTTYAALHDNNYDGALQQRGQEAYVAVDRAKIPRLVQVDRLDRDVFVALRSKPLALSQVDGRLSWKNANTYYTWKGGARHAIDAF